MMVGKVTTIVMIQTTIVDVNEMVETVVEKMLTHIIAKNVNVLTQINSLQLLLLHALVLVVIKIGKVTNGVMMKTTIVAVNGMVETVVEMMYRLNIAKNVYVLTQAWLQEGVNILFIVNMKQ